MKKLGIFLCAMTLTTSVAAQSNIGGTHSSTSVPSNRGILNHLDLGVSVGTTGVGVDVAMPVGNHLRVRAGYNYMPRFRFNSDFYIDTSHGSIGSLIEKIDQIEGKLEQYGVDINSENLAEYREMFETFSKIEKRDYVTMSFRPTMHQFKFMVDVLPFKNKHWSFTAGFFAGPSVVADATNLESEQLMLQGINAYNEIYAKYPEHGINGNYLHRPGKEKDDPFYRYGMAGFCFGEFEDGDIAMMVPTEDATVKAEMEVSKVRPYIGFGYNTHLSRDKKWGMNVDAGVMFLCGSPRVYVDNIYKIDASDIRFDENGNYLDGMGFDVDGNYYGDIVRWFEEDLEYKPVGEKLERVDVVNDLSKAQGRMGDLINTISKFKVYPNLSVTFSYRLF